MAWDDNKKQKAIELYSAEDPTPANSMEIVTLVAEKLGETVNGVRMILTKAGVYVKKAEAPSVGSKTKAEGGEVKTRVSKASAIDDLKNAIEAAGGDVDEDILSKLTGKVAMYFTQILKVKAGG